MKAEKIRKFLTWQWAIFMIIMVITFTVLEVTFPKLSVDFLGRSYSTTEVVGLLAIILILCFFVGVNLLIFTGQVESGDIGEFYAIAIGVSFFMIIFPTFLWNIIYYLVGVTIFTALNYHFRHWPRKVKNKLTELKLG